MIDFRFVFMAMFAIAATPTISRAPLYVSAFQHVMSPSRRGIIHPSYHWVSATGLSVFNDNLGEIPDDNDGDIVPFNEDNGKPLSSAPSWLKQAKDINNKFWDYTCNFLYVAISCLILLNFIGFGYTISMEEGLNVMPIDRYRTERQWTEEIQQQELAARRQTSSYHHSSGILQWHGALLDAKVDVPGSSK